MSLHSDWILQIYDTFDSSLQLDLICSQLGISSNVIFYNPTRDIENKYLESSIFVPSSLFEGFGMVLIAAMSCGLRCVSFNCPHGPSDIISEGVDGFLVENGNFANLVKYLSTLIEIDSFRFLMGKMAKENVKRYSL